MPKILEVYIVVPVFNSEFILPLLIKRLKEAFSKSSFGYELILVDDQSSDHSWRIIQEYQEKFDFVKGIQNAQNLGQAYTTLKGISKASGQYIATIDDDLEYNPEEIMDLYHVLLLKNVDLVFGVAPQKYQLQGKNPYFAKLRNKMLNFIWNKPLTDSFKIFKRSLVFKDGKNILKVPFEVFLKKNVDTISIEYHDVGYNKRFYGKSNYTLWKKIRLFLEMSFN